LTGDAANSLERTRRLRRSLVGKCGLYCDTCRLHILKKCNGCYVEAKCPYPKCSENKGVNNCGECTEFPRDKHFGPMAVYAKMYLNWKKHEIAKA